MNELDHLAALYGPQDAGWLRTEFARIMAEEKDVRNVRVARMDDTAEMAQYDAMVAAAEAPNQGKAGDWEITSPHSGIRYIMGCNW
jgi:hypothetical protein